MTSPARLVIVVVGTAAHHGVVARQVIDHLAFLDESIANLSAAIRERLAGFEPVIELLCEVPGWGRSTAEVSIAETGGDMSVFPTPEQLASWAGVAPGTHEVARAAARTKTTFLAARYRRIVARRGPNRAAVAVAHTMLVIAWNMLTTGEAYRELGEDYYSQRHDAERRVRRLTRQLEQLGFDVELTPAA